MRSFGSSANLHEKHHRNLKIISMLLIEFNRVPLVKKSKIAFIYSSYIHLLSREL